LWQPSANRLGCRRRGFSRWNVERSATSSSDRYSAPKWDRTGKSGTAR
jgi:hypothetical protein